MTEARLEGPKEAEIKWTYVENNILNSETVAERFQAVEPEYEVVLAVFQKAQMGHDDFIAYLKSQKLI